MGLDMYITARRYLWDFGDHDDVKIAQAIGDLFPELKGQKAKTVSVEAMYWRKANAIHKWFVDNVQDGVDECQETYLNREDMQNLLDVCRAVIASPDQANVLLPAQSGFFFGSTDYDEWYFDDVKKTIEFLENLFSNEKMMKHWDFYYQSSW